MCVAGVDVCGGHIIRYSLCDSIRLECARQQQQKHWSRPQSLMTARNLYIIMCGVEFGALFRMHHIHRPNTTVSLR